MKKSSVLPVAVGFLAGILFSGALGLRSQPAKASLARLADERAEISKMDWLLMNAQISTFEWMFFRDLTNPVIPMGYRYEAENNRIVSSHLVRPEWYFQTNLEEAKQVLTSRASSYCVQGVMVNLPVQDLLQIQPEIKGACRVDFYTLAGEAGRKDVATYENGQLILK